METVTIEVFSSCLALPEIFAVVAIFPTETCVRVHLACRTTSALCPLCQRPSERVHGTYSRTIADVPCGGQRVVLCLLARKFVCATASCPRQIFTERLSDFVQSYARMTNRLKAALQSVGLAAGGEMGTRLAGKIGMTTTPTTMLRQVMKLPLDACPKVRVLGIDDFGATWKVA